MNTRFACFIGWSNTGKTGFVEALARYLSARSIPCGALKCVHHDGSFNLPGKDSTRFFDAGAGVALVSDTETLRMTRTPPTWDRAWAASWKARQSTHRRHRSTAEFLRKENDRECRYWRAQTAQED